MKNIKKALIYIWIFFQALLVIAIMGVLVFSAITKTPIRSLFDYDWWLLFFIADMWIAHFMKMNSSKKLSHPAE